MALNDLKATNWLLKVCKVPLPVIFILFCQTNLLHKLLLLLSHLCFEASLLLTVFPPLCKSSHVCCQVVSKVTGGAVISVMTDWKLDGCPGAWRGETGDQETGSLPSRAPAWIRGLHQMVDLALPGCRETQSLHLKMVCHPSDVSEAHWQAV